MDTLTEVSLEDDATEGAHTTSESVGNSERLLRLAHGDTLTPSESPRGSPLPGHRASASAMSLASDGLSPSNSLDALSQGDRKGRRYNIPTIEEIE